MAGGSGSPTTAAEERGSNLPGLRTSLGIIILTILLIGGIVGYGILGVPGSDGFSELSIVPGCDDNRSSPTQLELYPGESNNFTVTLQSHAGSTTEYTVITELHTFRIEGNQSVIETRRTIDRTERSLTDGGVFTNCVSVTPQPADRRFQLIVFVYRGTPPDTPNPESADNVVAVSSNRSRST